MIHQQAAEEADLERLQAAVGSWLTCVSNVWTRHQALFVRIVNKDILADVKPRIGAKTYSHEDFSRPIWVILRTPR